MAPFQTARGRRRGHPGGLFPTNGGAGSVAEAGAAAVADGGRRGVGERAALGADPVQPAHRVAALGAGGRLAAFRLAGRMPGRSLVHTAIIAPGSRSGEPLGHCGQPESAIT